VDIFETSGNRKVLSPKEAEQIQESLDEMNDDEVVAVMAKLRAATGTKTKAAVGTVEEEGEVQICMYACMYTCNSQILNPQLSIP
jgi:hypothetical protein